MPSKGLIYRLMVMAEGYGFKAELQRGLEEHGCDTRSSSLAWWCRLCRAIFSFSHLAVFTKGKFRMLLETPRNGYK